MIRVFIQSIYPAPYRVGVFNCLAKHSELEVFVTFEKKQGDKRNIKWFKENCNFTYCFLQDNKEYKNQLKEIKEKKYDVVIAYDYSSFASIKLLMLCIIQRIPYCINCDGAFIKHNIIKDRIKSFFIKRAIACFANGEYAKKYFLEYGAKEENIFIHKFTSLHNNEIVSEPVTIEKKNKIKEELGIPYEKVYLSIGRFISIKGYDLLLKAVKETQQDNIGFIIVGGGEKVKEYEKYISKNKLKNIQLIGYKDKKEIMKYYDASDIFIFPTRRDVWGLVINEAMSRGLPIISTDMCLAARELVENGKNGKIIEANSFKELVHAIKEFNGMSNEKLRKMGKKSIEKNKDYTIENIAESHVGVLKKIYKGR